MTTPTTKTFTALVQDFAASAQSACQSLLDFAIGAILRAIAEATAGVNLWLQWLVLRALTIARLSSSAGTDVDSFLADFGLTRLPAVSASGSATFSRFTPTNQAVVPIGTQVQTADGTQTFIVVVDTSNGAYSGALGGYVIAAGVSSGTVPVQALTAGLAGNIVSGVLTVMMSGISGVDSVTNPSAFTNGLDAETDSAAKARFVAFIASLSKATNTAITYAISTVQQGLTSSIIENQNFDTSARPGYFTVVVDDGSGSPPASLITAVFNAINPVRPLTVSFGVFGPITTSASVTATLVLAAGYDRGTVVAQVATAWNAYIGALGLNVGLPYTRLAQLAYDASPGVVGLTGLLLNSGTADIAPDPRHVIRPSTMTVN